MKKFKLLLVLIVACVFTLSHCKEIERITGTGESKKVVPEEPKKAPKPYEVKNPEPGSPEEVVLNLIKSGLIPDEEQAFEEYLKWHHSDWKSTEKSIAERRNYDWARFRKCSLNLDYVKSKDDLTFTVTRKEEYPDGTIKLFIQTKLPDIMPKPIKLRKDKEDKDQWRVDYHSL